LIELLVVMAIIGMLLAVSVPALSRYAGQARLKAAARETVGLLSLARSLAIGSRSVRTVIIDGAQHQLLIHESLEAEPRLVRLASSVTVAATAHGEPIQSIVFKPTGGLEATGAVTITLSNGTKSQTVTVASTTGSISVQ
jgi:Tfp pilus assembly protein FimT